MLPGAAHPVALPAGGLGLSAPAHADISVLRTLRENVEPAAVGMHRNPDFLEYLFRIELLPVIVVIGMSNPIGVKLGVAAQQFLHADQRKKRQNLVIALARRTV